MANKGHYQKKKAAGGGWKKALIAVLGVVLLLCGIVAAGYYYVESKLGLITQAQIQEQDTSDKDLSALIGKLDETEPTEFSMPEETTEATTVPEETTEATEATTEAPTEPDYGQSGKIVNILVVGQDSRDGEESKLADSIILFTLNKETNTLTLTSFLRDSYVNLPNYYRGHTCGWNRINTSYALGYAWFGDGGAMEMLNLTLEDNYGVKVDGNVEISFDTFITIIDMLGGIELEFVGDEYKQMLWWQDVFNEHYEWLGVDTRIDFHEGVNLVNGDLALEYARERHMNDSDNDMNRANRQRIIISKVLEKCKQMSVLELNNLLDAVLPQITTNISTDDMKLYIKELLTYIFNLEFVNNQCPAEGTYYGKMVDLPDGPGGVLMIDFNKNKEIMKGICYGETTE